MDSPIRRPTFARLLLSCLVGAVALAGCGGGGSAADTVVSGGATPAVSITADPEASAAPSGEPSSTSTAAALRFVYSTPTALWSVGLDGPARRIAKRDGLIGLDVSPDGRSVAFSPNGTGLYIVGVDGRGLRLFDAKGAFEGDQAFSPDGRAIAVTRGDGVFMVNIDGTGQRRLTKALPDRVQFHPSGRYVGIRTGNVLETVPVDGGPATPVLTTERPIGNFAYSPDGRRLVYGLEMNDDYDNDLFVADADGANVRRLTTTGDAAVASWSPDGTQLAFHRGGEKGVWLIDADGANLHRLAKRGSYPLFSADGRHIAIGDGAAGLRVVRPDGSVLKVVGRGYVERFAFVPPAS